MGICEAIVHADLCEVTARRGAGLVPAVRRVQRGIETDIAGDRGPVPAGSMAVRMQHFLARTLDRLHYLWVKFWSRTNAIGSNLSLDVVPVKRVSLE
jgi:hypothetical protein